MDLSAVPWPTFVITILSALIGPIVLNWQNGKRADRTLKAQHEFELQKVEAERVHEEKVALRQLKQEAYLDALNVYFRVQTLSSTIYSAMSYGNWLKEAENLKQSLHRVRAKVTMVAPDRISMVSAAVATVGTAVILDAIIEGHRESSGDKENEAEIANEKQAAQKAKDQFDRRLDVFEEWITADLQGVDVNSLSASATALGLRDTEAVRKNFGT